MSKPPPATFVGFISKADGHLTQEWFDSLCLEDRDELRDTLNYLVSIPVTEWRRPEVDKVNPPLVEIRCKSPKTGHTIRLYGVFSEDVRAQFIILSTTEDKKKSYDKPAQDLADKRMKQIKAGKASVHNEFSFKERADRPSQARAASARTPGGIKSGQKNRLPDPRHQK